MNTLLNSSVIFSHCDQIFIHSNIFFSIGELIVASNLTFQDVYNICEANAEDMLKHILTAVSKRHGASKLQQIYTSSNCKLEQFISDGNLNCWLKKNVFKCDFVLLLELIFFFKF